MIRVKLNRRIITVLLSVLALSACGTMYSGRPQLQNVSELKSNEVVLVGRIDLVPPLSVEEQQLETVTSDRFKNKASALFSSKLMDLNNLPMSAGSHSVMAEIGKDFFARFPKSDELIYSGSVVLMRSSATSSGYMGRDVTIHVGQLNLPGGIKYSIKPDDRAVYVGHIRYYRDKHNNITRVKFINDYKRINKEFVARFGKSVKLRYATPHKM